MQVQVCADLFLTSQNYLDIASLSVVPRTTGGQVCMPYYLSTLHFHFLLWFMTLIWVWPCCDHCYDLWVLWTIDNWYWNWNWVLVSFPLVFQMSLFFFPWYPNAKAECPTYSLWILQSDILLPWFPIKCGFCKAVQRFAMEFDSTTGFRSYYACALQ